jgi:uncharacterized protein (TIGR03437 family)
VAKASAIAVAVPLLMFGYVSGPDPRNTGAPGDQTCAQAGCHSGTPVNSANGSVEIIFPGALTYVPGEKQRLQVRVTDSGMRAFGFQATARLGSNLTAGQAGTFSTVDRTTQVICDDGSIRPTAGCRANFAIEFIEHTNAGSSNTFTFEWTPPATDVGEIRIYVAGNAANGNVQNTGDRIYTKNYTLTPAAGGGPSAPKPTISSGGISDAFSKTAGVAPSTWISIAGSDLAATSATWDAAIAEKKLPTALEGASATVDGKAATIYSISPTQMSVLTPNDIGTGSIAVVVKNANGESTPLTVDSAAVKPAFYSPFSQDGKLYVNAIALDGTVLGKQGSDERAKRMARPGERIVLFGTGFGATNPVAPTDQVVAGAPLVTSQVRIRFGETVATFVGPGNLVAAGLYQFVVTVPDTLTDGEYPLIAEIDSVSSSSNVYVTVQKPQADPAPEATVEQ